MPYIKTERRRALDTYLPAPQNAGELNYRFTDIIRRYFESPGRGNYQAINDIIGALEGAKLEFYRRVAVPYEEKKIVENGDVY